MSVLTRRPAWPRLHLAPGTVARYHNDAITLFPLAATRETGLSVQPLSGGGYGVILNVDDHSTVVAQYPTCSLARRQLRRLAGDHGWGWAGGLGRGLLVAALLFLIWFLFFLPVDLPTLSATAPGGGAALALADPAAVVRPPAVAGPAFIDDPTDPAPAPNASGAASAPVLAR